MAHRLLREEEVQERVALSHAEIWRRERAGTFPAGRKIGKRGKRWLEAEIDAYIESLPRVDHAGADVAAAAGAR